MSFNRYQKAWGKHFLILLITLSLFALTGRTAKAKQPSNALQKAMGLGLQPSDKPEIDRFEAIVRAELDENTFKSAWEKGQAMTLEQAVAFALEEKTA